MTDNSLRPIILLVDDMPTNLDVLIDALGENDLNVSVALSGEEALKQVHQVNPDIILLDVIMPGIDGFETCRRLKANETTRDIPVIFMTALSDTVDKMTGFETGGVDYITKPFQHEEVLARVNAHLTIRRQQQQLQDLNASKDKLFSILAHDLRSSVTGFLAFGKILKDIEGMNKAEFTQFAESFQASAEQLAALLENLLTWSRVQRGMLEYYPYRIPLGYLVQQNIKLLRPTAQQKGITLSCSVPDELYVRADANMLDTIIRNLISNALKFTHAGGTVAVTSKVVADTVEMAVSDTGIGMSAKTLATLFQIGIKSHRRGTAGEKGTGLGLILCKEFVELHGSTLSVTSREGQGTTFTFSVPIDANV